MTPMWSMSIDNTAYLITIMYCFLGVMTIVAFCSLLMNNTGFDESEFDISELGVSRTPHEQISLSHNRPKECGVRV